MPGTFLPLNLSSVRCYYQDAAIRAVLEWLVDQATFGSREEQRAQRNRQVMIQRVQDAWVAGRKRFLVNARTTNGQKLGIELDLDLWYDRSINNSGTSSSQSHR